MSTTPATDRPRSTSVAVARVVLVLVGVGALAALAWWVVRTTTAETDRRGGSRPNGFVLEPLRVPADTIVVANLARDGIPAMVVPGTMTPEEVDRRNAEERGKYLVPGDWIIGVRIGAQARAYPLRVLNWHEIVNDTLGGLPIAVTYNPLSFGIAVFDRRVGSETLEFGVSGLLFNSSLVMYDRSEGERPESLWSQLQARAIAGPAASEDRALTVLPCSLTTWGAWREREPDTTVIAPDPRFHKQYPRDPYGPYFETGKLRFPVDPLPPESGTARMTRVLVVREPGGDLLIPLDRAGATRVGAIADLPPELLGWLTLTAVDNRVAAAVRGADGSLPGTIYAFWFAWYATHPDAPGRWATSVPG